MDILYVMTPNDICVALSDWVKSNKPELIGKMDITFETTAEPGKLIGILRATELPKP